jgi:hypothetical protein
MSLKEKAIEMYKKQKESIKETELIEEEQFTKDALKVLIEIIGIEQENITISKHQGCIDFFTDGISFRASRSQGDPEINIMIKCPICETEIFSRVTQVRDIGRALVEPHFKYDCDQVIRLKKEIDDRKNGKVAGTEERLLSALREFISESSEAC